MGKKILYKWWIFNHRHFRNIKLPLILGGTHRSRVPEVPHLAVIPCSGAGGQSAEASAADRRRCGWRGVHKNPRASGNYIDKIALFKSLMPFFGVSSCLHHPTSGFVIIFIEIRGIDIWHVSAVFTWEGLWSTSLLRKEWLAMVEDLGF